MAAGFSLGRFGERMRTTNGLYSLLHVLPGADPEVIEAAYKALMKKYHPDRHNGEDAERRAAAISHAFNILRDPDRRAAYDAEEKALQDRYRIELARASPAPPSPPEPSRRPPSPRADGRPRPEQRIAVWVGAAGALVLAVTVVLFARDTSSASRMRNAVTQLAVAEASDVNPAAAPVPFRDQAVSRDRVATAVKEFHRLASVGGLPAVFDFSERCFEAQAKTLSVSDFDFCVAFDHAAGQADFPEEKRAKTDAVRWFQPQTQVARHVRAADPMADTFASIELRLFDIRRLGDSVLDEQRVRGEPEPASAARVIAHRPQSVTRRVVRQSSNSAPAKREEDFLEREGGIY